MKSQKEKLLPLLSVVDSRDGTASATVVRDAIQLLVHQPQFFPEQQEQQVKIFS